MLPAVELALSKNISPARPPTLAAIKFCVTPELFVIPVPWKNRSLLPSTVIVNALAPELNVIPATVVSAEIPTEVVLEVANVAVSVAALGTVPDDQFVAVFQSALPVL